MLMFQINLRICTSGFIYVLFRYTNNICSRSIINNMGGQFQSNSTDLFSTAAAVTRRYGSAAGFTCVYLCSTIRVKMHEMKLSVQALRPALAIGTHGALPLVGGASITMLGCHCGKGKPQCK